MKLPVLFESQDFNPNDVVWIPGLKKHGVILAGEIRFRAGTAYYPIRTVDQSVTRISNHAMEMAMPMVSQYSAEATQLVKNALAGGFRQYNVPAFHPDGEPVGFLIGSVAEGLMKGEGEQELLDRIRQELLNHGWTQTTFRDTGGGYKVE